MTAAGSLFLRRAAGFALCLITPLGPVAASPAVAAGTVAAATLEQRRAVAEFARCFAQKDRAQAIDLVLNTSATDPVKFHMRPRPYPACGPTAPARPQPAVQPQKADDALLFALAETLVRQEFPTFDPTVIATAAPLPVEGFAEAMWPIEPGKKYDPEQLKRMQEARARANAVLAPQILGDCAVRGDAADAHRLLTTDMGSADEGAALQALVPALGQCLERGAAFSTDRSFLRGIVALSYYRIAHAPRANALGARK